VHADEDRERLRQTFDAAAARYDRVRPEYPGALFDDLVALAELAQEPAGEHLALAGRVHVGGVEEGDAAVDRLAHQRLAGRLVQHPGTP